MTEKSSPLLAPPRPGAMIESLRSVGYESTTAVADIIDNSISAGASRIEVDFQWHGKNSFVMIRDNGSGMSADKLSEAMRFGSRDPARSVLRPILAASGSE